MEARSRTIYCAVMYDNGVPQNYNLFFTKAYGYKIPKGWYNPNGFYCLCYKNIKSFNKMNKYLQKMLNMPEFKLSVSSIQDINGEVMLKTA